MLKSGRRLLNVKINLSKVPNFGKVTIGNKGYSPRAPFENYQIRRTSSAIPVLAGSSFF